MIQENMGYQSTSIHKLFSRTSKLEKKSGVVLKTDDGLACKEKMEKFRLQDLVLEDLRDNPKQLDF